MLTADLTPVLRPFRPEKSAIALGLAVSHLMVKPAFAGLKFGEWSRILVGQINRRHYFFAIDEAGEIHGFAGWALTNQHNAEGWLTGRRALTYEDSVSGQCVVFNAWSANSSHANRFLLNEVRKIFEDKDTIYYKRFYKDGRIRPVRLSVNDFVTKHIIR